METIKKLTLLAGLMLPLLASAAQNKYVGTFFGTGSGLTNVAHAFNNQLFVDSVNGNDSTAVRGSIDSPYLTIAAALAASHGGDLVKVGPGSFTITSSLIMPTNVTLQGAGPWQTIVVNNDTTTNSNHIRAGITLSTGCSVLDLQVTNKSMNTVCQRCIGMDNTMGDLAATNFWVQNIVTFGDCDNIFIVHTNVCQGTFVRCYAQSKWDACNITSGAHNITIIDCDLRSYGPSVYDSTQPSRTISTGNGAATTLTLFRTSCLASNVTAYAIVTSFASDAVTAYGGTFNVNGTNLPVQVSGNDSITFFGSEVDLSQMAPRKALFYPLSLVSTNLTTPRPSGGASMFVTTYTGFATKTNRFGASGGLTVGSGADPAGNLLLTSGVFATPTNYVAANFAPVAGMVTFPISNGVQYRVTQLSTNLHGTAVP